MNTLGTEKLLAWIRRFALLVLAAIGFVVLLTIPQVRPYLPTAFVICIVLALFIGRSYIRQEDIRGWALQNAALLAHAVLLILNGVLYG